MRKPTKPDDCVNCGAWSGLHHADTTQCPMYGLEAGPGRQQFWEDTKFEAYKNSLLFRVEQLEKRLARLETNAQASGKA